MRQLFILCSIVLFSFFSMAQQMYTMTTDERTGKTMLIGSCTREAYTDTAFSEWFNKNYNDYEIDEPALDEINLNPETEKILIVLGTWCGDSKREVPRFLKIMDIIGFPESNIGYLNVDRAKKSLNGEADELAITHVPTFIVLRNNIEVGRIVETPVVSLEKDLAEILKK